MSGSGVKNALLIRYEGGWVEEEDTGSQTTYGRREGFVTLGAVTNPDEVATIATALFERTAAPQVATRVAIEPTTGDVPYDDFDIGDFVTAPDENGDDLSQRVRALTVSEDVNGLVTQVPELRDALTETAEALARTLKRLANGTLGGTIESALPVWAPGVPLGEMTSQNPEVTSVLGGGDGSGMPPCGAFVRRAAALAVPHGGTSSAFPLDTEVYDTHGFWTSGDPSRFTAPVNGYYAVSGNVKFDAAGAGANSYRFLAMVAPRNQVVSSRTWPNSTLDHADLTVAMVCYMNAGETVQISVAQTAGVSVNTVSHHGTFGIQLIAPTDNTPTAVRLSTPSIITIANGASQAVTWTSEVYDYAGMWDSGQPTRITIPSAGVYHFLAHSKWDDFSTGYVIMSLRINGATTLAANRKFGHTDTSPNDTDDQELQVSYEGLFAAGDYVEVMFAVLNSAGSSRSTVAGQFVAAHKVQHLETPNDIEVVRAARVAGLSVASGTTVGAVTFDTESSDTFGAFTLGSPTIITIPITGFYLVQGKCKYDANATGLRHLELMTSGGLNMGSLTIPGTSGVPTYLNVGGGARLTAGTTLVLNTWQNSGGALTLSEGALSAELLHRG